MNSDSKRALLHAARFRFGAEMQHPRSVAIDKVVEQSLLGTSGEQPLSINRIIDLLHGGVDRIAISTDDIKASIMRLQSDGSVLSKVNERGTRQFWLSDASVRELESTTVESQVRLNRVVNSVFKDIVNSRNKDEITARFLSVLCKVFAYLGEVYAQGLCESNSTSYSSLTEAYAKIKYLLAEEFKLSENDQLFNNRVLRFFQENDPYYNAIKWNMAQNYYIAKMLGLDGGVDYFSREVFADGVFYLDTNIVITAINPVGKHFLSFQMFVEICKSLNITIYVTHTTFGELSRVIEYEYESVSNAYENVPDDMVCKTRGTFFEIYTSFKEIYGEVELDKVFEPFRNAKAYLQDNYGIEEIDDPILDKLPLTPQADEIRLALNKLSQEHRKMAKGLGSLNHDVTLLLFTKNTRKVENERSWIITLDTTLPGYLTSSEGDKMCSLAFCLDSIMQYLAPLARPVDGDIDDFAELFSESISRNFLPREQIFDIGDFVIFTQLGIQCKELPSDDIEDGILLIKNKIGSGLHSKEYVEEVAYELQKFFNDPSRRFSTIIADKDTVIEQLEAQLETQRLDMQGEIESTKLNSESEKEKLANTIGKLTQRLEDVERRETAQREVESARRSKRRRTIKTTISISILILFLGLATFLINKYGAGSNLVQKLANQWELELVAFFVWIGISAIIFRGEDWEWFKEKLPHVF